MTADPLAFLRAAHAEAEKTAEAAAQRAWSPHWEHDHMVHEIRDLKNGNELAHDVLPEIGQHIEANDPAAALRRIAADRKAIERHRDDGHGKCVECGQGYELSDWGPDVPCDTIRDLASGWNWTEEAATDADAPA